MNLFFWKKNGLIDNFATQLADELYSQIQPAKAEQLLNLATEDKSNKKNKKQKKSLTAASKALIGVIQQVHQFREQQKLGIYGKARLQMQFMERLRELGYPENVTEVLNKMILVETA